MAPELKVVQLYESSLHDVPAKLRLLADEIERGEKGAVSCCAVAVLGDRLDVHAFGPHSEGPTAALVFNTAALFFAQQLLASGR